MGGLLDIGLWKPVVTALLLPPVPGLLLILLGARMIFVKRGLGYSTLLAGVLVVWFSGCQVTAVTLQDRVIQPPQPLVGDKWTALRSTASTRRAIVVLGGGRDADAREYGGPGLSVNSAERLRYGIWLSRQSGWPMAFSGGVGWAQQGVDAQVSEADVAAQVARTHYGYDIRWLERQSQDTSRNAVQTLALLAPQGIEEIVLVTQAFHMPRARRAFERAALQTMQSDPLRPLIRIVPAPMAYWQMGERPLLDWLPSAQGFYNVRMASHELLGWAAGL